MGNKTLLYIGGGDFGAHRIMSYRDTASSCHRFGVQFAAPLHGSDMELVGIVRC